MTVPSFDSTRAVRFDLNRGRVCAGERDDRQLLVPADALATLVGSASAEVSEAFARALGRGLGERASQRIGDRSVASVEEFVTQLAGEAALAGVGVIGVERWGRALVVVIEESPLPAALLSPFVEAALEGATGHRVWCTLLDQGLNAGRVFVTSESAIARVGQLLGKGTPWAEALRQLQGEGK